MKMLRYLFALALALGLVSTVAKADDFHVIVVDPVYDTNYPLTVVTNLNALNITFTECEESSTPGGAGQMPNGSTYDGCFSFINETGQTITSITLQVNGNVPGQTAGCDTSLISNGVNISVFSSAPECNTGLNSYTLVFADGAIPSCDTTITDCQVITIAEAGVTDPSQFPSTTATLSTSATPEPSSLALMGSGTLSMAYLLIRRRRFALLPVRR